MQTAMQKLMVWAERTLKTDMRYLISGGFWLSLGRVLSVFLGLALAVAFANLLEPKEYGVYKFVLAIAGFLWAFSLTGLSTAITRAIAQGNEASFPKGLRLQLIWSTLISLVAVGISLYYFYNDNTTLGTALLFVAAFSPFIKSFEMYGAYLSGKEAFRLKTLFGTLRDALPTVTLIVALFITDEPTLLIATYFISHSIATAILCFWTLRKLPPNEHSDSTVSTDTKHLSIMNTIERTANEADKILLFHFLGAAPLAIYAFSLAPIQQLQGFGKPFQTLLAARLPKRDFGELRQSIPRKLLFIIGGGIALTALYIPLAPLIYTYLFPQYLESILFSQAIALGTLATFPSILLRETFVATQRLAPLYVSKIVSAVVRICLLLILIPLMGIWGAVIALVIPQLITFIILFTSFIFSSHD